MLRCFPPLLRAGVSAMAWALALAVFCAVPAAAGEAIAAAQVELASWIADLETAPPPAGTAAPAFPQAAAWLAAPGGGTELELARTLCRPRYASLASLAALLAARRAAGDPAAAAALVRGRILPTCFEIAVCLRVAAAAEGDRR